MKLTEQQYLDNVRIDFAKHLQSWIDDVSMDNESRADAAKDLAKLNSMGLQEFIDLMKDRAWDVESAFEFFIHAATDSKVSLDDDGNWST